MSKKLESNLILKIKVSRLLAASLCVVHLGAMALVALVPAGWWLRLGLWGLLGWSLYKTLHAHAWRTHPSAIAAIELDGEGAAAVRYAASEEWRPCRITARFVHPWLTLLALRVDGRRRSVSLAIAADAVEPEPFRRWRAALKLRTAAA